MLQVPSIQEMGSDSLDPFVVFIKTYLLPVLVIVFILALVITIGIVPKLKKDVQHVHWEPPASVNLPGDTIAFSNSPQSQIPFRTSSDVIS